MEYPILGVFPTRVEDEAAPARTIFPRLTFQHLLNSITEGWSADGTEGGVAMATTTCCRVLACLQYSWIHEFIDDGPFETIAERLERIPCAGIDEYEEGVGLIRISIYFRNRCLIVTIQISFLEACHIMVLLGKHHQMTSDKRWKDRGHSRFVKIH
jgi:hypothetical protein